MRNNVLTCVVIILFFILAAAFSWIVTTGIIYAIFLCFGWTFDLLTATGIWLILILIGSVSGNIGATYKK